MTLYGWLLFVHVLAVIVWFGGGVIFQIQAERTAATDDPVVLRSFMDTGEFLGKRLFAPLSGVVLLSGLSLVWRGHWGFDHAFVIGGLVGVVASGAIGGALIGPTVGRLAPAVRTASAVDDAIRADLTRLRNIGRLDAVVMTIVVFLMTVKPGG